MLFHKGFRDFSSFKLAPLRYLELFFSLFTHMACTQVKTNEIPISPEVFKPFSSRQYQDHIVIFFFL